VNPILVNTLDKIPHDINLLPDTTALEPELGPLVWPTQTVRFGLFAMALIAAFAAPLIHLKQSAHQSFFYEYIPFVPFLSAVVVYWDRLQLPQRTGLERSRSLFCAAASLGLLALYWGAIWAGIELKETEALALTTAAFLLLMLAGALFFFGAHFMRVIAFPVALCGFLVPPPPSVLDPIVSFMQSTSAWCAHFLFCLVGTPNVKEGMLLELPNCTMEITPECSGFNAGVILLLLGLMIGHVCFRSGWNRLWLALAIVPLAIARNGLRMFALGESWVHFGLQQSEVWMHRRGGAIFFVLSLFPLLILLVALKKFENRHQGNSETVKASEKNNGFSSAQD
jgi:exosortase